MQPFEPDTADPQTGPIDASLPTSGGLTDFLVPPSQQSGPDIKPGTRLGDVTIVRFIAEGGMGRVYEGLQGMPCRTVAVKVVRFGVLSPASLKRFEYEAQILGRLTHPGIARIYSVGMQPFESGGVPYFVMEYIEEALPITTFAADHELSTRQRLMIFREACLAVAYGHQRGVVHRDLKPGNILVDASGQARIIDFGVARSTDVDVTLTTMHTDAGQLVGTVQYMSPEQFDDAPEELDGRADVYALGVVLYELLAGRLPYEIANRPVYAIAQVVKQVEPTPITRVDPRLRGDLSTIVMKCLEKDRTRRYSSAAELEADLGRFLHGEPIAASPPRFVDSVVRLARRHKAVTLAIAGILTAIVMGAVGASIFAVQASLERSTALREKSRADAEADVSRQRLYLANLRSLQAAIGARNRRLGRHLYAENLAITGSPPPLEMRVLGATLDDALVVLDWRRGPVSQLAYHPDGSILAVKCLTDLATLSPTEAEILRHPSSILNFTRGNIVFFAVGNHQDYRPFQPSDADWAVSRLSRSATMAGMRGADDSPDMPLAVCPTSRCIAVYTAEGKIRVVDAATRSHGAILDEHRGRLHAAAFSGDGSRLAILNTRHQLGLWDAVSGKLIAMLDDSQDSVQDFVFSPDGSRIAALSDTRYRVKNVRLYDAGDGRHLSTVPRQRSGGPVEFLPAFSPDGGRLVTNIDDNVLEVWNVADGTRLGSLKGRADSVTSLVFSPDGRRIAAGFTNGNIRLWNSLDHAVERELTGHDGAVLALAFRPDGASLASGSHDGTARIWSSEAAEPLAVLPDCEAVTAATFSPDGRQLAVALRGGGVVELWGSRTLERLHSLDTTADIAELTFSPDGSLVVAAGTSTTGVGEARIWRTDTGELLSTLEGIGTGAQRAAFSPDGSRVITTSADSVVTIWEPCSGQKLVSTASDYRGPFIDVGAVFGLEGSRVAHRLPHLLDTATGEGAARLPAQGHISCLATSPDGQTLATGLAIGTVYLCEYATGRFVARMAGHTGAVRAISFNRVGTRMVTGSEDGSARLWDVRNGTMICAFTGHEGSVETALFTPDGRRVVTASRDGTARIWEAESGHELCLLPAPPHAPRAVALSPDGTLLLTAAADHGVRIWGLSNADIVSARLNAASAR